MSKHCQVCGKLLYVKGDTHDPFYCTSTSCGMQNLRGAPMNKLISIKVVTETLTPEGKLTAVFYNNAPLEDNDKVIVDHYVGGPATMELRMGVDIPRSHTTLEMYTRPEPGTKWRHNKRGSVVTVLHVAKMQHSPPSVVGSLDMQDVVIYRHDEYGAQSIWTRLLSEFMDGRFQRLT